MSSTRKRQFVWSKLGAAKWEDAWIERLKILGPGRLAIFALPGSRRIRLEAYALSGREARTLTASFGGQAREWKGQPLASVNDETGPLVIRDRLLVVRSAAAAKAARRTQPTRPLLIIPAAMAFGTGDHATTATCLRMIADIADTHPRNRWQALDLGTGTGILALSARLLGAARCDAWDYDPAAVRAVRENTRTNGIRGVVARRVDVTQWTPARQWDLVTANLFSDLLMKLRANILRAVRPGGRLIISGMLAAQAHETLDAFRREGASFERIVPKGKWVTALTRPFASGKIISRAERDDPAGGGTRRVRPAGRIKQTSAISNS